MKQKLERNSLTTLYFVIIWCRFFMPGNRFNHFTWEFKRNYEPEFCNETKAGKKFSYDTAFCNYLMPFFMTKQFGVAQNFWVLVQVLKKE